MAELDELSLDELVGLLRGENLGNPDVQYKATIKLGERVRNKELNPVDKERIVAELKKALDPSVYGALTRAHAAEALDKSGDRSTLETLMRAAMEDDYRLVRSYSTRALGNLGRLDDPELIECLISVLKKDEFFGVRAEAVTSMTKLCGQKNLNANQQTLKRRAMRAIELSQKLEMEKRDANKTKGDARKEAESARVLHEMDGYLKQIRNLVKEAEKLFRMAGNDDGYNIAKKLDEKIAEYVNEDKKILAKT